MPLTNRQFLELEGNIDEVFDAGVHDSRDFIPELFKVVTKDSGQFTDVTTGSMGRMTKWAGEVAYDDFEVGYEKQYRAVKYSKGLKIDRDFWEDKEFHKINSRVNKVIEAVVTTLQYDSAIVLEEAFLDSDLGPDKKALCSAAFKLTPKAEDQSNVGNYPLSYTGLESSQLKLESLKNDRGDKMLILGDLVIAGPQQRDTCIKLFGSDKEAFVGDNTMNAYKDMKFFIHPLITGKKWFLSNSRKQKSGSGLVWFMKRDPRKLERDGSTALGNFNSEILSWKAVGRYDYGFTDRTFIFGNKI